MQTDLNKYVFAQDGNTNLIICTQSPFYVGQIINGATVESITEMMVQKKCMSAGMPHGYNMGVVVIGALHNSLVVGDANILAKELSTCGREMADYLLENKIKTNLKYYERYKKR
jgi:hypothetical protein